MPSFIVRVDCTPSHLANAQGIVDYHVTRRRPLLLLLMSQGQNPSE